MFKKLISVILTVTALCPSVFVQAADDGFVMDFQGRKIDIAPFFESFPYSQFSLSKDGKKLFFQKSSDETKLQWIDLTKTTDLKQAKDAIEANLAKCNCWNPQYNASDNCMYWIGDESNDEIINIYRSNLDNPHKEKLTNVPYIYAWNFNQNHTKIAYVGRMGQNENRLDELHVLDLKTMKDELIKVDDPQFRYTWSAISWKPDDSGIMLLTLKNADRHYANVLYVDLKTKQQTVLTDASKQASYDGTEVMEKWINNKECLFFSNQDGHRNLYHFNSDTKAVQQLTHFTTDLEGADYVTIGKQKYIFGLQSTPIQTTILLMDLNGKILYQQNSDQNLTIGCAEGNKVRLVANNVTTLVKVIDLEVGKKKMKESIVFDLPENLKKELIQSNVERLSIPTFDIDPATGKQRMLHAYLFKPQNPLPADKQICMLESFYGGDNRYDQEYQIYNKAGIYVLSASPRGSSGFGRDFAAMNDGDLGGNEIIDIINCAKYISQKLNIPAERIGCFGVSHGGYATMRLMTFPGEVNGHKASFPFGFGIETSGFCDIIYQYYHCNIPDWITLEAGDPIKEKARIVDRSPLFHASKLSGPMMLVHGTHDNRVDIEGSRVMDRALTELGLPHKYIEFEGLGHGVKGKEYNRMFYKEAFNFLNNVIDKKPVE